MPHLHSVCFFRLHRESEYALFFPKECCVMLGKWYGPELVDAIGSALVWSMFTVRLKTVNVVQFLKLIVCFILVSIQLVSSWIYALE